MILTLFFLLKISQKKHKNQFFDIFFSKSQYRVKFNLFIFYFLFLNYSRQNALLIIPRVWSKLGKYKQNLDKKKAGKNRGNKGLLVKKNITGVILITTLKKQGVSKTGQGIQPTHDSSPSFGVVTYYYYYYYYSSLPSFHPIRAPNIDPSVTISGPG